MLYRRQSYEVQEGINAAGFVKLINASLRKYPNDILSPRVSQKTQNPGYLLNGEEIFPPAFLCLPVMYNIDFRC
jgi:hypothetical protein